MYDLMYSLSFGYFSYSSRVCIGDPWCFMFLPQRPDVRDGASSSKREQRRTTPKSISRDVARLAMPERTTGDAGRGHQPAWWTKRILLPRDESPHSTCGSDSGHTSGPGHKCDR